MINTLGISLLIIILIGFYLISLIGFYFIVTEYNKSFRKNDPFNKIGLTKLQKLLINILAIIYISILFFGKSLYIDLNLYVNEVYFIAGEILFYYFVKDYFKDNEHKTFYYNLYISIAIMMGFVIGVYNN